MKTLSKHKFSISSIQPNDEPREWFVPKVGWLQFRMDDIPLMYHLGSLSEDCDRLIMDLETGKETLSPEAKYLRKIRTVFWGAAHEGKLYLVQKRVVPALPYKKPTFEYWSHPVAPK
jgi:hypothetical protein